MDNKLNINGIRGLDGSYVAKLMPRLMILFWL